MEPIGYAVEVGGTLLSASDLAGAQFGYLHLGCPDKFQTIKIFPSADEATKYVCIHVSKHGHRVYKVSIATGRLMLEVIEEEKGPH